MDNTPDPRAFVLLSLEARNRGFRSTLAFRRWCQRHGVPLRVDGKKKWVRPADVTAAVEGLPITNDAPTRALHDAASAGVAALFGTNGAAA